MFSVYPALRLYGRNADMLHLSILIRPAVAATLLALVSYLILFCLYRQQIFAAIAALGFMILFWNYSVLYHGLNRFLPIEHWHAIPLVIFAYAHTLYFIPKISKTKRKPLLILCFLYILLLSIVPIYETISEELQKDRIAPPTFSYDSDVARIEAFPDIYLIILDEYARFDTIQEEFGYDNSPFMHFLKDKGFFVAEQSEVRYLSTTLNIASFLNFNWISLPISKEELLAYRFASARETPAQKALQADLEGKSAMEKIINNRLMQKLSRIGYHIEVFSGMRLFYPTLRFGEWEVDGTYENPSDASGSLSRMPSSA